MPNRYFDILLVADFRFEGGTSTAIAGELRALRSTPRSVGLYQINASKISDRPRPWHPEVLQAAAAVGAEIIEPEGTAEADLLVVHSPWVLNSPPDFEPKLRARLRVLVAHHPPVNGRHALEYDPQAIHQRAGRLFGGEFIWAPNSPVCRNSFALARFELPLLSDDWTNVIFVDDWGQARLQPRGEPPVIGRHSYSRRLKWPEDRAALLQAYPSGPDFRVLVMGLPGSVINILGDVPDNWQVFEPNQIPVRDFLANVDFFVYYHHSSWIESFGRCIAEAAAAGCIVIVPHYLEPTFGSAALYGEPRDVKGIVREFWTNHQAFATQSARAREEIKRRYGPDRFLGLLDRLQSSPPALTPAGTGIPWRALGRGATVSSDSTDSGGIPTMTGVKPGPRVCICICTRNRPQLLDELLARLAQFEPIDGYNIELLIIDNAPTGSSKQVWENWQSKFPIPIHFVEESKRGIPFARNRAVDTALDTLGASFVAFIDDDDTPKPDWLQELLRAAAATDADLVFGKWMWSPDTIIPPRMKSVSFLRPATKPDQLNSYGIPMRVATCNVLLSRPLLEKVRRSGQVFSERFINSGGSDTEFFVRARKMGATFHKCESSIVFRRWDKDRMTLRGVLRRAFRYGVTQGRIARLHLPPSEFRRQLRRKRRQLLKHIRRCLAVALIRKEGETVFYLTEAASRAGEIFAAYGGDTRYYK